MPIRRSSSINDHGWAAGILILALLATWLAYSPGISGAPNFDDRSNLGGLVNVHDLSSAINYIGTGSSGLIGRPVALASFASQAYAWPHSPEVFLRTNILIHLLNGALVAWFLYLLGLARHQTERQAALTGAASAGIWMLMPILASSSLFIVQRMTTFSATFVLMGAVAYLYARRRSEHYPVVSICGMTLAIGLAATLGALTKENGVLLFLFVLATEATILDRPARISRIAWRGWFSLILIMPAIALTAYLATRLPYSNVVISIRDFNGVERLLTQAEVLWKYLYLGFIPHPASISPFHDDYVVRRSLLSASTMLAVVAWAGIISAAVVFRKKAPLFSFAVAWYLLGHSLESTTLPLELYFEHRNYMPLIGPVYALVASVLALGQWRRIIAFALAAYVSVIGATLFSVTSLWGSPALAAEIWYIHKPTSVRAVQTVAQYLEQSGDPWGARLVLSRFAQANSDAHNIQLQLLGISCQLAPESDIGEAARALEKNLAVARFNHGVVTSLHSLHDLVRAGKCPRLDDEMIYRLGQSLLNNPSYNSWLPGHNVHVLLAHVGLDRRDIGLTMMHLEKALDLHPDLDTLEFAIGVLNSAGLHQASRELLARSAAWKPRNPVHAVAWQRQRDALELTLTRHSHIDTAY